MDIDELKDAARQVKAPDVASLDFGTPVRTIYGLADELRGRDAAERKRARRMMVVFGLGAALFSVATFAGYVDPGIKAGRALLVAVYGLVVAASAAKLFRHTRVDYAAPTLAFLKKAEKRYRFISPWEYLYMVPGLLAAALAGWLILASGFDMLVRPELALRFNILYGLGFAALLVFSFIVSRAQWKKETGPLYDRLVRAMEDFEADGD
ncbi:MAG TPA: hypothetical protein PLP83_10680 [Candidatus Aminicenantes bacterium]|nr:hypothetical protein [Candidatus Aminicenantes bacterium]